MREPPAKARLNRREEARRAITHRAITLGDTQYQFIARACQRHIEETRLLDEMRIVLIRAIHSFDHARRRRREIMPRLGWKAALRESGEENNRELKSFTAMDGQDPDAFVS